MAENNGTTKKKTNRRPFWQEHLRAWSESGLTQADYCRKHEVSAAAFAWWKRQLQGKPRSAKKSPDTEQGQRGRQTPAQFIEVQHAPSSSTNGGSGIYEVLLSRGRAIRVDRTFDPEVLQRLIVTVESSC